MNRYFIACKAFLWKLWATHAHFLSNCLNLHEPRCKLHWCYHCRHRSSSRSGIFITQLSTYFKMIGPIIALYLAHVVHTYIWYFCIFWITTVYGDMYSNPDAEHHTYTICMLNRFQCFYKCFISFEIKFNVYMLFFKISCSWY